MKLCQFEKNDIMCSFLYVRIFVLHTFALYLRIIFGTYDAPLFNISFTFVSFMQTALHWGAKHGNLDIIKLIAGTYKVDANTRTVSKLLDGKRSLYLSVHCTGTDENVLRVYRTNVMIRNRVY